MNICRKASEARDRLLHRTVAAVLAAAMTLSFLPATSWAVYPATPPVQITNDTKSEFPNIEFQTNFVRTEYGTLTGLMELAIRVGPSKKDGDDKPIAVNFQSVAATLQYNTTLFQPISWKWAYKEDGSANDVDLKLSADKYYDVQLPAKKDDTLPGTGAIAQCGIVDNPTGMTPNVADGKQALLFFKAEAYGTKLTLTEMTTLAVIRFYVKPELMEHISIVRDKTSIKPDGSCDYNVFFDTTTQVTDRAGLDAAIKATDGQPKPTDPADALDPDLMKLLTSDFISVGFAADEDMAASKSPVGMSLHYSAGDNEFYFVPDYAADDTKKEKVKVKVGTTTPKTVIELDAPVTKGSRVLAVAEGKDNSILAADYSYLSNLIPADNITFPVVSRPSFADNGDGRENMATVVFYDWDDTLIGVLVVPRNDNSRALVNDYVCNNMIHPDLRYGVGDTAKISSLARQYTYRGKYPCTPMAENGTDSTMDSQRTDKLVGSDYPLTNKLDYVFLKRPMTLTTSGVTSTNEPTSTWTQLGTDGAAEWDDEYPYIHGWALIPDKDLTDIQYTHPENVWTTIGMGELGTYNGTVSGGYQNMNGNPGQLTAIGQEFTIANFDFHENVLKKGSVYAVKAIYEPGESLGTSLNSYRMVSEPYYNKLNTSNAENGGAYSVDITLERAAVIGSGTSAVLCGVARIREPYVRQDTTSDLRWETLETEDFTINHDLPNATYTQAYQGKGKTTYTKVDVKNTEEVEISLTLSARQNKVDYYLNEGYNFNFVSGGARSVNDSSRSGSAATMDNYNYFVEGEGVDGSDEFDEWYDASYEEREGSRGYVLTGTLNQLMEIATQKNNNEVEMSTVYRYMTAANFMDINLRMANGRAAATYDEVEGIINALLAAAEAAKPSNNGGSTKYWNTERNCAQLTYHQLQGFIIDGSLNHDEHPIMSGSAVALTWCHLHKECVDAVSSKPRTWTQLIDKARNSPSDIEGLTPNEMEALAHLRADANGTPFASVTDFKDAMVRAVAGTTGNLSWDQVQANILGQTLPAQEERVYWWYDGSTVAPMYNSLSDTVSNAEDAITAVTMPDGTVMVRNDKFNLLKTAFEENADSATVARRWNNATKNLCITKNGSEGEKFDTFAQFRTAFVAAVTAAQNAGVTLSPGATNEEVKAYWQKLQYHILNKTFSATHLPEMDGYWWYDGNSKIGDLASLLAAARRALPISQGGENDSTIYDMFTLADLYSLTDLHLRKSFKGEKYDGTADLNAFKGAVKQFVQLSGVTIATSSSTDAQKANSWNQLQYYILHPTCDFTDSGTLANYLAEVSYYWWRNGADGEVYTLTANSTDVGIATLMEAVYRTEANGNPKAYDQLTASVVAGEPTTGFRLVSSYTTEEKWADLPKYGSTGATMDALKTQLADLYAAIVAAGDDYKTVSWRQIQHFLLGKGYVSKSALAGDDTLIPSDDRGDKDAYWWREGDEKPGDGPKKTNLDYFLEEFDKFLGGTISEDDLVGTTSEGGSALDKYVFSGALGLYGGAEDDAQPIQNFSNDDLLFARFNFSDLANGLKGDGVTSVKGIIDWYVLQYYAMFNSTWYESPTITPENAKNYYENTLHGNWIPAEYDVSASGANLTMRKAGTIVEVDPDTGVITTTSPDAITELPGGLTQVQRTITVLSPEGEILEVTTFIEIYDADYNLVSEQTVTMPVPEPEEPTCTCGSEDGTHAEDCPLYEAPTETEEPTESPEPTESAEPSESPEATVTPEPTESVEPSESPEATPTPEPTDSPAPTETAPPEEELPEPSVPGAETPEVTVTPEPTPTPEVSPTPEPTPTPEATVTPELTATPGGTLETMPEIIDPDPMPTPTPEPTATPEVTPTPAPPPTPPAEAVVTETDPPAAAPTNLRTRSAPMVYNKLTTKLTMQSKKPVALPGRLLLNTGGMNMKQLKLNRIFSPPGRSLLGAVPLRSYAELRERGCAV